jgi:hypothetical protein
MTVKPLNERISYCPLLNNLILASAQKFIFVSFRGSEFL